jgi:hypothetical protein
MLAGDMRVRQPSWWMDSEGIGGEGTPPHGPDMARAIAWLGRSVTAKLGARSRGRCLSQKICACTRACVNVFTHAVLIGGQVYVNL